MPATKNFLKGGKVSAESSCGRKKVKTATKEGRKEVREEAGRKKESKER